MYGAAKGSKTFNDEHIPPDRILRRYKLHGRTIVLPNGQTHRYATYTISCCETCNPLLGDKLETPLSIELAGGHEAVAEHLMSEGPIGCPPGWRFVLQPSR